VKNEAAGADGLPVTALTCFITEARCFSSEAAMLDCAD
jgi:hypothetical protein